MLDSIGNFHLWNGRNWQTLELNESPCHRLSKSAVVCFKVAIDFEKFRRECEVFEVTKYVAYKFDLSDPVPGRARVPDFHSF